MSDTGKREQEFLAAIKHQLDESEQALSADELRALRLARTKAIESLETSKLGRLTTYWQPVTGFAMVAGVIATVVGLYSVQTASVDPEQLDVANTKEMHIPGAQSIEDLSLLSAAEELEFYENLEFYQWLELEGHAG